MAPRQRRVAQLGALLLAAVSAAPQLDSQSLGQKTPPQNGDAHLKASFDAARLSVRARLMDVTSRPAGSPCPLQENFVGDITSNAAAEVKYTWVSFDGVTWPEGTLHFAGPGTQKVSEHEKLGAAGQVVHGWMQLKVLSPNAVLSNRVPYTIVCPRSGGTGRVTRAVVRVSPLASVAASCPVQVNFAGDIATNGAADVQYTWTSSDNATWPHGTLHFTGAGTQAVKESWTLGGAGQPVNGWVRLKVLSPNALTSNPAIFRFQCAAGAK
jgi:hypothetical protein